MKLPGILNRSVAIRTTIMVLGIVTIITLVGGLWQMNYTRGIVAEETHRQASRSMENAIKVIDNRVSTVETAVKTAASYAYMMAPHEMLANTLLQRLIEANEDIAAVTLMYKADYFPDQGRYYAPTISRDPMTGELTEDEIGGPDNDFCYLETDSNWIYTNKLDKGYWCLPYIDSMSTKRAMVSYSIPLHDEQGETYAILCADVDLRWVQQIVEGAKPYDYSEVFILGRDSQFVCHPDIQWIQTANAVTQLRKIKDNEASLLANKMLRWERGVDTINDLALFTSNASKKKQGTSLVFYAPVSRVQWSVCFTIPEEKVMEQPNRLRMHMLILLIVLLLTIGVVLKTVIHSQLFPLKTLANSASEVAKGDFNAELPNIKTEDEIRELRDSFENMQISLTQYIDQLQKTTASKAMIEGELHIASDIQMSMLPKAFSPFPDHQEVDIYGRLKPAKAVGGDLFDFYFRDNNLFFCIGDVSGKGVPAALVMAVTQAQFRTISMHETAPNLIVRRINDAMAEGNDSNMFVTLFVGVLDLKTGHLSYCNAGHDAPLLIGERGIGLLPCNPNLPAGVMDGWDFTLQETEIDDQTTIFLYTDGLTEAEDINHEQFQEERINEVAETSGRDPKQLIDNMTEAVHTFVGEAEQSDDLTMLSIHFKKFVGILLFFLFSYLPIQAADINITPDSSLTDAIRKAREMRRLGQATDVTIHLGAGTYWLYEPIRLRPEDSGLRIEGENAVISGGVAIKNWKRQGKLMVADVPDFNGRPLDFRQLWVNGEKAIRARDVQDFEAMNRIRTYDKKNHILWVPKKAVETIMKAPYAEMVLHEMWCTSNLRIKSLTAQGDSVAVRFHNPEAKLQFEHPWPSPMTPNTGHPSPFYLTNAKELLDEPGEWYHDIREHKLYYMPRESEKLKVKSEQFTAVVPVLETLVEVIGTAERPVRNIEIKGVTFSHTTWMRPSEKGHVPLQAGMYLTEAYKLRPQIDRPNNHKLDNQGWLGRADAAVELRHTENINFENCRFKHLGGSGLDYVVGCRGGKTTHCTFTDIAMNGYVCGSFSPEGLETHLPYQPTDFREVCTNQTVEQSLFYNVTNEDWGCVAICAGYVSGINIEHNTIHDVSYTGISLGWGWNRDLVCMKDNKVHANLIYNYAQHMYDCAGIYTLGNQPGTLISENVVRDIATPSYVHDPNHWFYLYTDEGSSNITIRDNWTPAEKFLKNANGPGNIWENNGPQVNEQIKNNAGIK